MSIDIEAAGKLLDFGRRLGESQAARAREQLEGAVALHNILDRHEVAYLADEVGMGKTYVALGALALFRHFNPHFRVLIIAPRQNIQSKWVKEFRNFVRHNVRVPDLRVRGLNFEPARPLVECERLSHFVREVTTDADRDFFLRLTSFSLPLQADGESTTTERLREQFLRELPWIPPEALDLRGGGGFKRNIARAINCALPVFDLVIVDEAHHLKHGAQRAAARNEVLALMMGREVEETTPRWAKGFGPRAKRVLFLSATPLEESFKHVWNQLDVFGKAGKFEELRAPMFALDEETKKKVARKFMIRRVTAIPIGTERFTKNRYRREWRRGGVRAFDEPIMITEPRQRLVVALVQKKISELLGSDRFGNRFQVGMLASFESFQETIARKDDVVFDGDQTENELEKDGIDVKPINTLAKSYRANFNGKELPHPKLDALVEALGNRWTTGRKALVFVRRVASVKELKRKLDDKYDDFLETKLLAELPAHTERLTALFSQYRKEKTEIRNANQDVFAVEVAAGVDEAGGSDTFFAWFFRGRGPGGVFSGAALKKRFVASSGVFSTFFEENVVSVLLNVPPSEVPRRLAEMLGKPVEQMMEVLAERARHLLRAGEKVTRSARFDAVQAAAIEQLCSRDDGLGTLAKHVWHELYEGLGRRSISRTEEMHVASHLSEETFFTGLRHRPELARALLPGALPKTPAEFNLHWFRVALLGSLARLGHALIDLYITVVGVNGSLDLGRARDEDADGSSGALIQRFLDLLDAQAAIPSGSRTFGAFDELRLAAENFDTVFDTNLTHLQNRTLREVRRAVGSTLGEQQPTGGMHGSVNKSLISQFRMPGYPFVLVTTDLLQEGEDLHTFCSDVFHYGISWTPSAMEQRVGRIDRVRSQTDRRLSALTSGLVGDDKLQVFVPTLRESVEVLQVNRVLRRMNRFVELMHEGIGQMRDEGPQIDVSLESLESMEPPPPLPDEELKSSFGIDPLMLTGKRTALDTSEREAEALVRRFHALRECSLLGEHRLEWEPVPTDRDDRLFGTVWLRDRKQPFGLYLRLVRGRAVLKCVSPIGRVGAASRVAEIAEHAKHEWSRIGLTEVAQVGSYDLTVEDEVLIGKASTDIERLHLVIVRVVSKADQLELLLLKTDEPLETFRSDLAIEGSHES